MSPTAEQLIRDYLNQVSVAARSKLRSDQRRAFLARMRDSIERNCGAPGSADPAEVARVLVSLGDPNRLVDLELARIASIQDEAPSRTWADAPRLTRPQGREERRESGRPRPGLAEGLASATGTKLPASPRPAPGRSGKALGDRPLTGEIKVVARPITSRWRPGAPLQPRDPKPKRQRQVKPPKPPRQRRLQLVNRLDLADTDGQAGLGPAAGPGAQAAAGQGTASGAGPAASPGIAGRPGGAAGPGSAAPSGSAAASGSAVRRGGTASRGDVGGPGGVSAPGGAGGGGGRTRPWRAGAGTGGGTTRRWPGTSRSRDSGANGPGSGTSDGNGSATGSAGATARRDQDASGPSWLRRPDAEGTETAGHGTPGSGISSPGTGSSGTGGSGTGGSSLSGPGIAGPGIAGPGIAGPGTAGPGTAGPGTGGSGAAGSSPSDPGANGSGEKGSGIAGPGIEGSSTAGPGAAGADAAGSMQPWAWHAGPEVAASHAAEADVAKTEVAKTEVADTQVAETAPVTLSSSTRLSAELLTRTPSAGSQLAGVASGAMQTAAIMWRRSPLDVSAVLVLLLAGLIYPFPVWLVGFVLWVAGILAVVSSRTWAPRDKLAGLLVPVIAAVVGTALALAVGGSHDTFGPYAHEIATTGPVFLRIAIIIGAIYLGWQARRGRRAPAVPPWNRPHRI